VSRYWLIARRHYVHFMVLGTVVEVMTLRLLQRAVSVPGRDDGTVWVLAPLLPALPALALAAGCAVTFSETERVFPSPVLFRRLGVIGVQALFIVAAAVSCGAPNDTGLLIRNGIMFSGVSLCSAGLLPSGLFWIPVVLLATGTWIIGVPDQGNPVPRWALLLHDTSSTIAWGMAIALEILGALFVITYPSFRPSRQQPRRTGT